MTLNINIRNLIKSYIDWGLTASEIYGKLNKTVWRATVYRWQTRITRGPISAKSHPGQPRTVRTKQLIAKIKRKSANKIANEECCSITTVGRVIHGDLSLNTYKKIRAQTLTANQIQKRKSFAHQIKNRFGRENGRSILFYGEKWFNQDGQYNRKNECVYAESREAANRDFGTRPIHKFPFKGLI